MIDPFPLLLAGHAVGDWVVQTDEQAANKSWPRPPAEFGAALDHVGVDESHPDPELDQVRAARQWMRRRSLRANQQHIATYHLTIAVALIPWAISAGDMSSHGAIYGAMAVSWLVHSLIDRRWPVRWLLEHTGSKAFARTPLGMLAADQALHIATLALMAAWLQAVVR